MVTKQSEGRRPGAAWGRGLESAQGGVLERGYACERALEAICIPEEDSRLHARARVDFGSVQIDSMFSASIAGNFSIRMHVPRALQQQISGNGLVGSVLGSARISADISERVGNPEPAQGVAAELCVFVGFHQAGRGNWMVDLRVLRGGHLRVPVRVHVAPQTPATVAQAGYHAPLGALGYVDLNFAEDATASLGPVTIVSGAVADLWRSIRDEVRTVLTQHISRIVLNDLVRARTSLRGSLRRDSNAADRSAMTSARHVC